MLPFLRPARRDVLIGAAALAVAGAAHAGPAPSKPGRQATIDAFVEANAFSGVIMLGRNGRPTLTRAYGFADIEAARPMRADTTFGIASISKWLTTLTVLRLVQQGRLDLDAPITTWLKDYRPDTGAKVTLRHLLSNSSGVANLFSPTAKLDPAILTTQITLAEAVNRYGSGDLTFEPGTKFDYAFTNWFLVMAIIEAASGRAYAEAMRLLTLRPLGLTHTGIGEPTAARPDVAGSYSAIQPPTRKPGPRLSVMAAAGGYYSQAADLLRAAHGVYDGAGFLSSESRRRLTTVLMTDDQYALGGRVKTLSLAGKDRTIAWETGNTAGYRSVLAHRLDDQSTVVILNNTSLSQKVLDDFAKALFAAMA